MCMRYWLLQIEVSRWTAEGGHTRRDTLQRHDARSSAFNGPGFQTNGNIEKIAVSQLAKGVRRYARLLRLRPDFLLGLKVEMSPRVTQVTTRGP